MKVSDFDFDLPEHLIALRPLPEREQARLLVVRAGGSLEDKRVADLEALIRRGDMLVVNNTKVLAAALTGRRARPAEATGAPVRIEVNLNRALAPDRWQALVRPAKRLRVGDAVIFGSGELSADVLAKGEGGLVEFRFSRAGADLAAAVDRLGAMPLPPYIARRRAVDAADVTDYQTIFARETGAVAAPTAALHFTPALCERLAREVPFEEVTLHVGAGTFLPVKADDTGNHKMHAERAIIDAATAARLTAHKREGGRVVAIGTTTLRVLEAAAQNSKNTGPGVVAPFDGDTDIFITPGYEFKIVDALLTNFHLPRSTLFMLVAAFSGLDVMRRAYAHAVAEKYRFFSYGDACFLEGATA